MITFFLSHPSVPPCAISRFAALSRCPRMHIKRHPKRVRGTRYGNVESDETRFLLICTNSGRNENTGKERNRMKFLEVMKKAVYRVSKYCLSSLLLFFAVFFSVSCAPEVTGE